MKPMLARTVGPRFDKFPCFLQPKLNGIRALAKNESGGVVMQSRDEKLWSYTVLRHIMDEVLLLSKLGQSYFGTQWNPVFDGELYVHGWRLGEINSAIAVKRNEPTVKTKDVQYHLFDCIPNLETSFVDRWVGLSSLIKQGNFQHIHAVPTHACDSHEEFQRYFRHYTAQGYEGVMLRTDEPYEMGETDHGTQYRSTTLWKHKQWEDSEWMCVGTTPGEGKAAIGIGALILRLKHPESPCVLVPKPEPVTFKVGTGFSDAERIFYAENPPLGKLVRVRYLELTADGIPFNPSFLAVID